VYKCGIGVAFACTLVLLASASVGNSFWLFTIGLFLMTGAIGFLGPNTMTLAMMNQKKNAGAAAGLSGFMGSAAGFISMSCVAQAIGTSSVGLAIYIAVPMALTGLSVLIYRKRDSTSH
jgi:MFS family permease